MKYVIYSVISIAAIWFLIEIGTVIFSSDPRVRDEPEVYYTLLVSIVSLLLLSVSTVLYRKKSKWGPIVLATWTFLYFILCTTCYGLRIGEGLLLLALPLIALGLMIVDVRKTMVGRVR